MSALAQTTIRPLDHLVLRGADAAPALVLREGRAASRDELIDVVWHEGEEERPSERTIDVHIRRLRAKLGGYSDIIRTVRGQGYRFDRHADVEVLRRPSKSPDRI